MKGKETLMKLSDMSNGPDWIIWAAAALFALISIILLSGRGSGLIAGYNTVSKEEKAKYNAKKLCRVYGGGMAVITILLLVMGALEDRLPAWFVYIAVGIVVLDVLVLMILGNTVCKKR